MTPVAAPVTPVAAPVTPVPAPEPTRPVTTSPPRVRAPAPSGPPPKPSAASQVLTRLDSVSGRLTACANKGRPATWKLTVKVGARGKLLAVSASAGSLTHDAGQACMEKTVRGLSFPAVGETVTVTKTLRGS